MHNSANDIEDMVKRREIRNSTAEFLIFQAETKEQGVEVYYKDENIWATQKAMAALFDVNVPAISKHLKNIFESGELKDDSVVSKMEITASDVCSKVTLTNIWMNCLLIASDNLLAFHACVFSLFLLSILNFELNVVPLSLN